MASSNHHLADSHDLIRVQGARENNLKDVSVEIPKRPLTVFTGLSESGKASLVFGAHADWIIGLGPGAGHDGGRIVFEGIPADLVVSHAPASPSLSLHRARGIGSDAYCRSRRISTRGNPLRTDEVSAAL